MKRSVLPRSDAKASTLGILRSPILAAALVLAGTAAGCSTIRDFVPRSLRGGATAKHVRRLAVLPLAYRAAGGQLACDVCPDKVVMDLTSKDDALLVTAFVYEALSRHPRLQLVPFETVEAAEGASMRDTLTRLSEKEQIDAVVVGALLELRERRGDPREPAQRGGAAVYMALLDLPSGRPVWKRLYDRSPGRPGRAMREYQRLVVGEESKPMTAYEVAKTGVDRMVKTLVRAIR